MKINNLDLNKFKCFQAVAERGSLIEGAKLLNITTSAVYQSIKKLEADLQRHLFFRSGKKYVLTEEGRNLQELFSRFLWDVSNFQEKARPADSLEGDIRVGLPLNFSKAIFIPLMREFQKKHPQVTFHLTIAETRRLSELITSFDLDFAITDDSIPSEYLPKIQKREVFKEELAMVCSRAFLQDNQKELNSIKLMKDLRHLDYSKNLPLIQRWYKMHYKRPVKIAQYHIIDNVETMVAALRCDLGLGVIPRHLLDVGGAAHELAEVTLHDKNLFNLLFLIQESNYINNTLLKRFFKEFEEKLRSA